MTFHAFSWPFMPFHALGLQFLDSYLCLSKTSRSFSLVGQKFPLKNILAKNFRSGKRSEILRSADSIPTLSKCTHSTKSIFSYYLFTSWRFFSKCWFSDVSLQGFCYIKNFGQDLKIWVSFSWHSSSMGVVLGSLPFMLYIGEFKLPKKKRNSSRINLLIWVSNTLQRRLNHQILLVINSKISTISTS